MLGSRATSSAISIGSEGDQFVARTPCPRSSRSRSSRSSNQSRRTNGWFARRGRNASDNSSVRMASKTTSRPWSASRITVRAKRSSTSGVNAKIMACRGSMDSRNADRSCRNALGVIETRANDCTIFAYCVGPAAGFVHRTQPPNTSRPTRSWCRRYAIARPAAARTQWSRLELRTSADLAECVEQQDDLCAALDIELVDVQVARTQGHGPIDALHAIACREPANISEVGAVTHLA